LPAVCRQALGRPTPPDAAARSVNFLLDAPPDKHGLIPETTVAALMRLRRQAGI
jgi:hypothetical protein